MDNHKKSFIVNSLRRATYRWPGRWLAEKRSKLSERGSYFCEQCGLVCRKNETQMDHIIPVVLTSGWDGLENVADRMFCAPSGFQRLCKPCHHDKTVLENQARPRPPKKIKIKKRAK
jgi:5-methylcytosine-specific restriction endonuclease McrA